MRWEDISLANAGWRIERTKNGTAQEIHLPPQVIEILRTRERENINDKGFVFPSKKSTS